MSITQLVTGPAWQSPIPARRTFEPAVSVVIPTYNRADLLDATLDSVATQTFKDYVIILVDDGSKDDTRERVAARKEPIRYLWQANQGVSEARNHALRVTRSEFVAFLDSDDMWEPTFLERTVRRLRECPHEALVFTDFVSTDERGRLLRGHRKIPHAGDVTGPLFASTFIHTSAVVARAAIIRDAGGFDGRLTHNEDYDLWLRLSLRHQFGLLREPLCRRRCHRDSLSRDGCPPDVLLRKAQLLERFYDAGGGRGKLPEQDAYRRLARLYYTAGKAFVRAGRSNDARAALRQSLRFRAYNPKTLFWYLRAGAPLAGQRRPDGTVSGTAAH